MPSRRGLCLALFVCLVVPAVASAANYDVQLVAFPPSGITGGQIFSLPVGLKNNGDLTWVRDDCAADTKFYLLVNFYLEDGTVVIENGGERTPIPTTMKPGDSGKVSVVVRAPKEPGTYTMALDMVHEGSTYFSDAMGKNPAEFTVKVKPAASSAQLTAVEPVYPLSTTATFQRINVLRTGNCPVTVDFGDGMNAALSPTQAQAGHKYASTGKFKVTATAQGGSGCSGTVSTEIEVADTACPFLPIKVCTWLDFSCCDVDPAFCTLPILFGPPQITLVDRAGEKPGSSLHPGDWVGIEGTNFGQPEGKAELLLKNFQGNDIAVPFKGGQSDGSLWWTSQELLGRVPLDLSGVMNQTGFVRITTADGKVSNLFPVDFVAELEVQSVPPSMVSVSCANNVSCNLCNTSEDGCEVFGPPSTSIDGYHQSIPFLGAFGICAGGGGSGTDHYSVTLKNQWRLGGADLDVVYGDGKVAITSGFAENSSQISGDVSWSVDSCQLAAYTIDLVAIGPRGVPMQ